MRDSKKRACQGINIVFFCVSVRELQVKMDKFITKTKRQRLAISHDEGSCMCLIFDLKSVPNQRVRSRLSAKKMMKKQKHGTGMTGGGLSSNNDELQVDGCKLFDLILDLMVDCNIM